MFLKNVVAGMLLAGMVQAATPTDSFEFPKPNFDAYKETTQQAKKMKRTVATEIKGTSKAFQDDIMAPWLTVKGPEDVSNLLTSSYAKYASYKAPDVQYFLTNLHTMIPLKGIVWRLRPLFETGFKGNRATHVSAVQMVRNITTMLSAALPTVQTDALIKYFTMPGPEMTENSQFQSIQEFQSYLVTTLVPALNETIARIDVLHKANPSAVWVWDNKMFFGTASFRDGFNQYIGHGPAERHLAMAVAWEAIHDSLVFSAYNQNDLINVAGRLGRALGMDVFKDADSDALGLTDKERVNIIKKSVEANGFLDLKGAPGTKSERQFAAGEGAKLMSRAYAAKTWMVINFNEAYNNVKGKPADIGMVINPALYQANVRNRLNNGVGRMSSAIQKPTEFRDTVTAETVVLNVPAYYSNPPKSLASLMANDFERGEQNASIRGADKKELKYRNYLYNRSTSWNNNEWSKYVQMTPEQMKDPGFMLKAKRVVHYSLGATPVFGAIDLFVR